MFGNLSLLTLQQYWWFLISLIGALFVFITFVQGGQTLLFTIAKDEKQRDMLIASLGRKWELSFTSLVLFGGALLRHFLSFMRSVLGALTMCGWRFYSALSFKPFPMNTA